MDDVLEALGLTGRTVSTVEVDGRPARRTQVSRLYPTDAADLWHALTDAERLPRWFLPISGDLREGGHYQLEGNAGGDVELCEPPHRFRVTWGMGDAFPETRLTVTLTAEQQGTRLELDHVGQVPDELWAQFGPGATGVGWDLALHGLDLHITSGAANDPQQVAAWTVSAEGVAFIRRSERAWCDADAASGTPVQEATARAARTFAFYTGQDAGQDAAPES
jgi:uncharacterized protein YndB with AHSA1/START domain